MGGGRVARRRTGRRAGRGALGRMCTVRAARCRPRARGRRGIARAPAGTALAARVGSRRARMAGAAMALAVPLAAAAPSAHARLLSPARGQATSLEGVAGVQKLVLDRAALAALRARDSAVVRDFPLGRTRAADLLLARFEPFAAGARVEIVEAGGARSLALPDRVCFRGRVAGEDDSHVLLIAARARVHGFVVSRGEVFPFGPDGRGGHRSYALRDADPTRYPPPGDFCANDLAPEAVRIPPAARALAAPPPAASTSGTLKLADVAIDTDQELRAKFASDSAALGYLAALAAAATSIYERDLAVRPRFSYLRLWGAAPPDPWTATDPSGTLGELRTYWNNPANNMDTIAGPRTVVHFVSGKSVQGGIAYLDVLCDASYGYRRPPGYRRLHPPPPP